MHGRTRTWARRIGLVTGVLLLAAGVYAGFNRTALTARLEAYRLRTAATDEDRTAAATRLVALGGAGSPYLVETLRGSDPAACTAVVAALNESLEPVPTSDPRFTTACRPVLDGLASFSESGRVAVLELVPLLLRCPHPDAAARCRDLVRTAFQLPAADDRVRAIRLALRPDLDIRSEVVPLLDDASAAVRRAAMLVVGPVDERAAPVIEDEALFRWLHDPDAEVRELTAAALRTRGMSAEQVQLARQLTHPDPAERLKLLLDLQFADTVRDPGPWLERLSRDPEPAVRVGVARCCHEYRLQFASWLDQLADRDPDPTVRRWAGYYRGLSAPIHQTGGR
jgi:hypothetical protein